MCFVVFSHIFQGYFTGNHAPVPVKKTSRIWVNESPLQWRHNKWDGVSNHHRPDCLLNLLSRRRSKKTSKLRVTGLCEGNSPVTGEFPTQRASNAVNVSIWWRHHDMKEITATDRTKIKHNKTVCTIHWIHCVPREDVYPLFVTNGGVSYSHAKWRVFKKLPFNSTQTIVSINLGFLPANKRRRYKVTPSLIG